MPYRKEEFANEEIYHVILRGLNDNMIFKDINDYYRGIFSIYEFNNSNSIEIRKRREERKKEKASGGPSSAIDKRDKLVEILCFCFMPNHIHLLVKQSQNKGITKFMSKIGTGYAGYFNRKYERKGYVFQNRFRSIHIDNDNQFRIVFNYIHANPISLIEPGWKEKGIKDLNEVVKFLEGYKWSSYLDYIKIKNFSSVTDRNFMTEFMGGAGGPKSSIKDWVEYKKELVRSQNILLE
jgi:putative transposase